MASNDRRTNRLGHLVDQLIRVGVVSSIDADAETARVVFDDQDEVVSYDLRVVVRSALSNKDYWVPDVDEQVLCFFLPTGVETGFIVGSFYSSEEARPVSSPDIRAVQFNDGTLVQYDRASSHLSIDAKGTVDLVAVGDVSVSTQANMVLQAEGNIDMTAAGTININGSTVNIN